MQSNQLTILVIDDSEIIRERFTEILSRIEGVQCIGKSKSKRGQIYFRYRKEICPFFIKFLFVMTRAFIF
jgi:chemotaxis response regulator CheB